jgi:AcrR family transcriptional regulator
MAVVAAEAGVALKTVYVVFETKAGLVRALWNYRLRGDQDEAPMRERPWYRKVLDEPDPERQLRLTATASREVKLRIGPVMDVIRSAAPAEPEIAGLWVRIGNDFHGHLRGVVESLAEKGALRSGLDVTRGTDILWTISHPDLWRLLVGERGWSPEDYERWCAEISIAQLLDDDARATA